MSDPTAHESRNLWELGNKYLRSYYQLRNQLDCDRMLGRTVSNDDMQKLKELRQKYETARTDWSNSC